MQPEPWPESVAQIMEGFVQAGMELLDNVERDLVGLASAAPNSAAEYRVHESLAVLQRSSSFLGLGDLVVLCNCIAAVARSADTPERSSRDAAALSLRLVQALRVSLKRPALGRSALPEALDPALVADLCWFCGPDNPLGGSGGVPRRQGPPALDEAQREPRTDSRH